MVQVTLAEADINSLPDRAAMGLPERFVPGRVDELAEHVNALVRCTSTELAMIVEDALAPHARRYAAGTLLALLGDPRIDPFTPSMLDVPGGTVHVGLDPARVDEIIMRYAAYGVRREWIAKECPRHTYVLAPYRIARYPVTNLEYRSFLLDTGHIDLPTSWSLGAYPVACANHPVYTIAAESADAYGRWLALRTGRRFRLPTEREWEHAAAGPEEREFPWGDVFYEDRANTIELGVLATTPVGMFPAGASSFGALDMAGNVEEFVADDYAPYPGGEPIADDLAVRHQGTYRIARGGSFARFADLARCARRHGFYQRPIYAMGFRLAEDP